MWSSLKLAFCKYFNVWRLPPLGWVGSGLVFWRFRHQITQMRLGSLSIYMLHHANIREFSPIWWIWRSQSISKWQQIVSNLSTFSVWMLSPLGWVGSGLVFWRFQLLVTQLLLSSLSIYMLHHVNIREFSPIWWIWRPQSISKWQQIVSNLSTFSVWVLPPLGWVGSGLVFWRFWVLVTQLLLSSISINMLLQVTHPITSLRSKH